MRRLAATLAMLLAGATAFAQMPPGGREALSDIEGYVAGGDEPDSGTRYVASPDQLIRRGVDRLAGFLIGSPDASEDAVRDFVDQQIAPIFDFSYMAEWAAGPLLHRLDDGQRTALTERIRELFLSALTRHLGALERPLPWVDVFPARPGRTLHDARVFARVVSEELLVRLEFRFYWDGDSWKVYDTVANGASAVAFYRGYLRDAFRRYGPDAVLR